MITMLTSTCPAMYAYPQLRQVTTLVWWERMPLVHLCRPICTLHSPAMLPRCCSQQCTVESCLSY